MKERTSITLRQRLLPSGRTTLYLDYICNGKRSTESLKLFLEPETSRTAKQKNRETMQLAEAILAKRRVQIQNHEFGFKQDFADDTTSMTITAHSAPRVSAKRAGATGATGYLPCGILRNTTNTSKSASSQR